MGASGAEKPPKPTYGPDSRALEQLQPPLAASGFSFSIGVERAR